MVKIVPAAARTITVFRVSSVHLLVGGIFLLLLIGSSFGMAMRKLQEQASYLRQLRGAVVEQKRQIGTLQAQKEEMKEILAETARKMERRRASLTNEEKVIEHLMEGERREPVAEVLAAPQKQRVMLLYRYGRKGARGADMSLGEIRRKFARLARERDIEERRLKTIVTRIPSQWPVDGMLASHFGYRTHPVTGASHLHTGIDIQADYSAGIKATAAGIVCRAGWEGGYGNVLEIDHGNGLVSRYAHCAQLLVKVGESVKKGATIGLVGSTGLTTGPHLHYEVRRNGTAIDPFPYLALGNRGRGLAVRKP